MRNARLTEAAACSIAASEEETAALMRTLYRVVLGEKRAGRIVHLSIAGGRKTMATYGMAVAQLLFDDDDRVWHLHSESWRPGNEQVMHAQPGDAVSLLLVPVLRWSSVSPVMTELAVREDRWEAIQKQRFQIATGKRCLPEKCGVPPVSRGSTPMVIIGRSLAASKGKPSEP